MFEPVEGINYIFDRYAFLNTALEDDKKDLRISPKSSQEEIAQAVKTARMLFHPDRQARTGEAFRKQAEYMSRLVDDCERYLINETIKPLYDEKLAEFQRDKPNMISVNGNAVVNIHEPMFSLNALLSDEEIDLSGYEAQIDRTAIHDAEGLPAIRALYEARPEDPNIRKIYRMMLEASITNLSLKEDASWAKVGVMNARDMTTGPIVHSDQYVDAIDKALEEAKQREIAKAMTDRVIIARIGMAPLPLLLTADGETESDPATHLQQVFTDPELMAAHIERIATKANENFEARAHHVREAAAKTQAVLEQLVELTKTAYINPTPPDFSDPSWELYLLREEDSRVLVCLELNASTGRSHLKQVYTQETFLKDIPEEIRKRNSIAVWHNNEIKDLFMELSYISEMIMEDYEDYMKQQADPSNVLKQDIEP